MGNNPNTTLAQLVAWTETCDNCKEFRFERASYEKLSAGQTHSQALILALIRAANKCSVESAKMVYATSWGRYQIMGFNLYGPEINFSGMIADYLANPAIQNNTVQTLLTKMGLSGYTPEQLAASSAARAHFGTIYNGSALYAEALENSLKHFGYTVF